MNKQKTICESNVIWTEKEFSPNVYNPQATIAALQAKLKAADNMARVIDEMFIGKPIWPNRKANILIQAREKYSKSWTYLINVF
jgi:hypothetical protein